MILNTVVDSAGRQREPMAEAGFDPKPYAGLHLFAHVIHKGAKRFSNGSILLAFLPVNLDLEFKQPGGRSHLKLEASAVVLLVSAA